MLKGRTVEGIGGGVENENPVIRSKSTKNIYHIQSDKSDDICFTVYELSNICCL